MKNREGDPVKTGQRDRTNEEGIDIDGTKWKGKKSWKKIVNCWKLEYLQNVG